MKKRMLVAGMAAFLGLAAVGYAAVKNFTVNANEFDPGKTYLVQAAWLPGIGCPTNATVALPNPTFTGVGSFTTYTDPACPTGDPQDKRNEGLLLAKTGPTANFAAAGAAIHGVKGETLTELGWDIRKPLTKADPRGSHCGAGAPRFNIGTDEGFYFIGCQQMTETTTSNGWIRLRIVAPIPANERVQFMSIVFDEGQDVGPDNFGLAVLDNINVNGVLVGRGNTDAS